MRALKPYGSFSLVLLWETKYAMILTDNWWTLLFTADNIVPDTADKSGGTLSRNIDSPLTISPICDSLR